MMKLETINIILAVIVVILLGCIAYKVMYKKDGDESFKYDEQACDAITKKYNKYLRKTNSVWGNPGMLYKMMSVCGTGYNQNLGGLKAVPTWARKMGGTHNANVTDIFNGLMYQ